VTSLDDLTHQVDLERSDLIRTVTSCPLCGSHPGNARFQVRQFFWNVSVLSCRGCGHVYKQEIPLDSVLAKLYSPDYTHFDIMPPTPEQITLLRPRVRRLGPVVGGARHLDFGCGTGGFVAAALLAGWDSVGCDPFLPAIPDGHPLKNRLHAAHSAGLSQFGEFDVISIWAAVEHMPQAGETLRHLTERLAPGGKLVFNSPNGDSIVARCEGPNWAMANLLEHHSFFTPRSVNWLARELRMEVVGMRRSGVPYPFGRTSQGQASQGLNPSALGLNADLSPEKLATPAVGPRKMRPPICLASLSGSAHVRDLLRPIVSALRIGDHLDVVLRRDHRRH